MTKGIDPAEEKARTKEPVKKPDTFRTVADEFIKRGLEKRDRAPAYITETRRAFENHVFPRWGDRAQRRSLAVM